MLAASGDIGLKIEAEHMHQILRSESVLLPGARPGARPGAPLHPRLGLTGHAFLAPGSAQPLGVQCHAGLGWLGAQMPAGFPPAPPRVPVRVASSPARTPASSKPMPGFSCGARTGAGPRFCRRGVRTPRISPSPCTRHGGGVQGSEFSLSHLIEDVDGQFLLRQQPLEPGILLLQLLGPFRRLGVLLGPVLV